MVIKLNDAGIYYEIYGSGGPLLLLHGNNQSNDVFTNQIGIFSKQYKVIAVDTRGQGKSTDFSTGPLTYDMFARDMKQLLDSLHITNAHILGWSDGGITGLIMAIKYPSYVNKLAVMGANLFPTYEALKDTVFDGVNDIIDQIKNKTDARSIAQRRLLELILNEPHLTFDELKTIRSPTLVMAGEDDVVVEGHTRAIAKNIPGSELLILKNATHFAPVYNIAEFNEAVLNFFNN